MREQTLREQYMLGDKGTEERGGVREVTQKTCCCGTHGNSPGKGGRGHQAERKLMQRKRGDRA